MFTSKERALLWITGFISGFNLIVGGYLLNFWLTKDGLDLHYIGLFAATTLPYALNFLWAPIFDSCSVPKLALKFGRRTSWLIILQICLAACLLTISTISPSTNLLYFAALSTCICFFASATDTLFGALRTEAISPSKQGPAAGIYAFGYRLGMLIVSTIPVALSNFIDIQVMYRYIAVIILFFPLLIILVSPDYATKKEQKTVSKPSYSSNFWHKTLGAIAPWSVIGLILLFLVLYRLADNFIAIMLTPFIISLGYNELEIATIGKLSGVVGAIIGGLIGSHIMKTQSIKYSLLQFGLWHGLSHCIFIVNAALGKNHFLLFFSISIESITGGMCMAAYIAFISSLCTGKYRATQYSFFSSMMGLSRSLLPTISGAFAAQFGWEIFFFSMSIASMPALFVIKYIDLLAIKGRQKKLTKALKFSQQSQI